MWRKFGNCVTILVRRASETLQQLLLHILFQECVSKQPPHVTEPPHLPIKIDEIQALWVDGFFLNLTKEKHMQIYTFYFTSPQTSTVCTAAADVFPPTIPFKAAKP